jgi:hypothetical protein
VLVPEDVATSPPFDFTSEAAWPFIVVDGRAKEKRGSNRVTQFEVCVMLASIEKRVRCVGVEVRSYQRTDGEHGGIKPLPPIDRFTEISSALWRSIPIGDLIERSIALQKNHYKDLVANARRAADPAERKGWEDMARAFEVQDDDEPDRPRRGPQRLLSLDDLTTVVAPAYLTGGRKPVVAVRDALSKHRGEPVTMEQARKAVVRARAAGALPPAHGRGKP